MTEGLALEYKGKKLIMEWVELPCVDLNRRFLYRFKSPIATVWHHGSISLASFMIVGGMNFSKFALNSWRFMVLEPYGGDEAKVPPEVKSMFLELEDEPELHECEIVRKVADPVGPINGG